MREFFNQIKIRNKILLSFVILAIALIILAIWQYRLYNYYGDNEKDNYKLLQNIALGNKLKENLADIQFLQYELPNIGDSSAFLSEQNKWEQYNLDFKRNLSVIKSGFRNYGNSVYHDEWDFIKRSNGRIEKIYDSLIIINIDTSFSLMNRLVKLRPQKVKAIEGTSEIVADTSTINENDLIFSESDLQNEESTNSVKTNSLDTTFDASNDNLFDFSISELEDNKKIGIEKNINEINQKLSAAKKEVSIGYQSINSLILKNEQAYYKLIQNERNGLIDTLKSTLNQTGLLIFGTIILALLLAIWLAGKINIPLDSIRKGVDKLNKGYIEYNMPSTYIKDELGEIQNELHSGFKQLSKINEFSKAIAKGNYKYDYTKISAEDILGRNLLQIRDNFQELIKKEDIRSANDERYSWINNGISKFNTLLRVHNNNLQDLSENILAELIKYVKAQQGGFFIKIEDEEDKEKFHLELLASYAFNRKKFYKRNIIKGEGLVGTVAVEGKKIYLTKLPSDYLEIRSGIGGVTPKFLLVLPLIINETVVGVLEIAALLKFESFEIEFIEKVAESIAASISAIHTNVRTSFLLEQSRKQAEELEKQQLEHQNFIRELQEAQQHTSLHKKELDEKLMKEEAEKKDFESKNAELKEMMVQENKEYKKMLSLYDNKQKNQVKILEHINEGIFIFNANGEIIFVNTKFSEIIGIDKDNCINNEVNVLLPEIKNKETNFIQEYIQNAKSKIIGKVVEFQLTDNHGEKKHIRLNIIDTSSIDEFLFTGFLIDLSLFIKQEQDKNDLKKQAKIRETKYLNKIEQLEDLLKINNIEIPENKENDEKLITNIKPLMLSHPVLDKGRIDTIEQLNKSYMAIFMDDIAEAQVIFNQFIKKTKGYFKAEEELLEDTHFDDLKSHRHRHKKITIKLLEYKEVLKTQDTEKILKYYKDLKEIIVQHFTIEDLNFKHLL